MVPQDVPGDDESPLNPASQSGFTKYEVVRALFAVRPKQEEGAVGLLGEKLLRLKRSNIMRPASGNRKQLVWASHTYQRRSILKRPRDVLPGEQADTVSAISGQANTSLARI